MKFFDDCDEVEEVLGQLAGFASMCWEPKPTGEFVPDNLVKVVTEAKERVEYLVRESVAREIEVQPWDLRSGNHRVSGLVTMTRAQAYIKAANIARG